MDAERWRKIEQRFHSALESEPEQRISFLSLACCDEDLLREVVSLLAQSGSTAGLVDPPARESAARPNEPAPSCAGHELVLPDSRPAGRGRHGDSVRALVRALSARGDQFSSDIQPAFRREARAYIRADHPHI